jgi:hypothetical protein
VHSSSILRSCSWSSIGGSRFSRGLSGGELFGDTFDPLSSDFESTKSSVSLACKVFLDHPQNYRGCWRGSRPSPVRVSNKQNMLESKNKSMKTRVRQTRLDLFCG